MPVINRSVGYFYLTVDPLPFLQLSIDLYFFNKDTSRSSPEFIHHLLAITLIPETVALEVVGDYSSFFDLRKRNNVFGPQQEKACIGDSFGNRTKQ
jgi:hypothetical protein